MTPAPISENPKRRCWSRDSRRCRDRRCRSGLANVVFAVMPAVARVAAVRHGVGAMRAEKSPALKK